MALLSDVPKVLRAYGPWGFTKRVWEEVEDDHLFTWAAALAYSWLFAIFPFMIFLMTLLPYLPAEMKATAFDEIRGMVYQVFPEPAANAFWGNIEQAVRNLLDQKEGKLVPRLLGLGLALWAASGGMAMSMTALDMCYEVHRGRPFYINRPLAIGMTIVVALFLLMVVCLLPIGTFVRKWLLQHHEWWRDKQELLVLFDLIRWPLAVLFLIAALSVLYQKGPSIKRRWTWITPGGVFCVAVWIGLGLLFRLYVTKYGKYNETYGTVGGVVVLLLFFYIDAVVLLVGAEINSEIDFKVLGVDRGSRDYREAEAIHRPRRSKKLVKGLAQNPTIVQTAGPPTEKDVLEMGKDGSD
jgi:membrane protein